LLKLWIMGKHTIRSGAYSVTMRGIYHCRFGMTPTTPYTALTVVQIAVGYEYNKEVPPWITDP
jgi:hypothetical protein